MAIKLKPIKDIIETKKINVIDNPNAPASEVEPLSIEIQPEVVENELTQPVIEEPTTEAVEVEAEKKVEDEEVAEKSASKLDKAPKGFTLFVTKKKEYCAAILVNGKTYDAFFDANKKIGVWTVADEDVEAFSSHMFCQHQKITQALK